jgi:integrase
MGHADPKTTRGYYTLVAEHLRDTVALLPSY